MGWPGYAAAIELDPPPPDALGCAAQLLFPADSDGSDSFQWWPPVLTPIRLGDSGKLVLAPHISARPTQEMAGEEIARSLCRHLTFLISGLQLILNSTFTFSSFLHYEYIKISSSVLAPI